MKGAELRCWRYVLSSCRQTGPPRTDARSAPGRSSRPRPRRGAEEQKWHASLTADGKRLLNQVITFAPNEVISKHKALACRRAQYEPTDYEADAMFQGNLPEPNPTAAAIRLGFKKGEVPGVDLKCTSGAYSVPLPRPQHGAYRAEQRDLYAEAAITCARGHDFDLPKETVIARGIGEPFLTSDAPILFGAGYRGQLEAQWRLRWQRNRVDITDLAEHIICHAAKVFFSEEGGEMPVQAIVALYQPRQTRARRGRPLRLEIRVLAMVCAAPCNTSASMPSTSILMSAQRGRFRSSIAVIGTASLRRCQAAKLRRIDGGRGTHQRNTDAAGLGTDRKTPGIDMRQPVEGDVGAQVLENRPLRLE